MKIAEQSTGALLQSIIDQGNKTINDVNVNVTNGTNTLEVFKDLKIKELRDENPKLISEAKLEISKTTKEMVASVNKEGALQLEAIKAVGVDAVIATGKQQVEKVIAEGNKQVDRVAGVLETKQDKVDNRLTTTSKNVVEAINEVNGNKLNKSGDNMTGSLTVGGSIEASKILSSTQKEITYGWGGIQLVSQSTGGTGLAGSTPANPINNWYHHMIFNHQDPRGYYVDMALSYHEPDYRIRRMINGKLYEWDRLLTDTTSPVDVIYSESISTGTTSFQIPTDKRAFRGYLVSVFTHASSHFDGVSTYFIPVTDKGNLKYGKFYGGYYDYIGLDNDWVIKPSISSEVKREIISVVGVDRIL